MAEKGLLIVYTGGGKGKTTAAMGQVLRALGHGWRVGVIQFIKGDWPSGEQTALERFKDLLDIHVLGAGFTWQSKDLAHDTRIAREAWAFAVDMIHSGRHRLIVLDELTYLVRYKMVPEADILDVLTHRPPGMHIIVTGRHASRNLTASADLVTEMRNRKHPFDSGRHAQRGIEF